MSVVLGDRKCYGCGKEIYKSRILSNKGYIALDILTDARPLDGRKNWKRKSSYTIYFCGITCIQKTDLKDIEREIRDFELKMFRHDWKNKRIGFE